MTERILSLTLVMALISNPIAVTAQAGDPDLQKATQLVQDGEYEQAVLILDPLVRKLSQKPGWAKIAAQAYLQLGIAYVGDGNEALARASFRAAVTRDPSLELSAFDVSPKVREIFQTAKDELPKAAPKKGGGAKVPLIVLGVAAVGGGVALAAGAGKGGGNPAPPPTVTIQVSDPPSPDVPLEGLQVVFNAAVSGGSGTPTLSWNFGDGNTATGNPVKNIYMSPGAFSVSVAATFPTGSPVSGQTSLTVSSLDGTWNGMSADGDVFVVHLVQAGATLSGDANGNALTGIVNPGRAVSLLLQSCGSFGGTVDPPVMTIPGSGSMPCRSSPIQQTLTKAP
jgi:hypothetical protein